MAPKYLEVDDGENADGDGGGTAEQKENPRTSDAALHGRTMFAEVGFLRAGYYEWQVMAVSLAGNGSWSESHFFEALEDTVIKPRKQSPPHFFNINLFLHLNLHSCIAMYFCGTLMPSRAVVEATSYFLYRLCS